MLLRTVICVTFLALSGDLHADETRQKADPEVKKTDPTWDRIAPFFKPPKQYEGDFGKYNSPLIFNDGSRVKTPADWKRRRQEILDTWHKLMGPWPEVIAKPKFEVLETKRRENFTQKKVRVEVIPGRLHDGYLLVPDGEGPFPAVLVVFYDAKSGAGLNKKGRVDFGYRLTKRNFVTLSIGGPYHRPKDVQPLSGLAYVASNCAGALGNLPEVDPKRIGVVGHSFGGKWAMFASCLSERFACAVWCDPGIVWNEKDPNANYWEPWYLGLEKGKKRKAGIPTKDNPRTGAYKTMIETGHDLHELHALMAPRPFLVSGGAQDRPPHWRALNRTIEVNRFLGHENRVAMTMRRGHSPTEKSYGQINAFFVHFLNPPTPKP